MSQPADFAAPVTLATVKSRHGDSKNLDSEDNSVRAYEASPAEIEDAVFGGMNADGKGPNYKNVSLFGVIHRFGPSVWTDRGLVSNTGRMDGRCRLDDEGAGRFGSLVASCYFSHPGSRPRSHRPGRDRCLVDL